MGLRHPLSDATRPSAAAQVAPRTISALGFLLLIRPAACGADTVISSYASSGYRYHAVPFGAGAGFEQPSFDDSGFADGSAPFGTRTGVCPLYQTVKTTWPINT